MTKLIILSDTHEQHNRLWGTLPPGDVFIHCGDWTNFGDYKATFDFVDWLRQIPFEHKVVIAGNHDKWAAKTPLPLIKELFASAGAVYLQDEAATVAGLKFYGTPWVPPFGVWSFMAGKQEREWYFNRIPDDTDVLVTHGPPYGVLDETALGERAGCPVLLKRARAVKPKVHCFGHIHEGYGQQVGLDVHGCPPESRNGRWGKECWDWDCGTVTDTILVNAAQGVQGVTID